MCCFRVDRRGRVRLERILKDLVKRLEGRVGGPGNVGIVYGTSVELLSGGISTQWCLFGPLFVGNLTWDLQGQCTQP